MNAATTAPVPAAAVNVPTGSSPIGNVPTTAAPAGGGLTKAEVDAELASVPAPAEADRGDAPAGRPAAGLGRRASRATKHLETFNAENLFEKIDGRAESFIQYDVKGMAYAYYHPEGDESNEVQLYIFEMANPLKAMGKYGSEKPEEIKPAPVGTEGYTSAGSLLFHAGPYYTQIVSTQDDAKFAAFALELAKRIAAKQKPEAAVAGGKPVSTLRASSPSCPRARGAARPKYIAQDVFGYSFLTDVFMADYKEGRRDLAGLPPALPDARGGEGRLREVPGQRQAGRRQGEDARPSRGPTSSPSASNIGLADAIFRKGNVIGGANGGTDPAKVEAFARIAPEGPPRHAPAARIRVRRRQAGREGRQAGQRPRKPPTDKCESDPSSRPARHAPHPVGDRRPEPPAPDPRGPR